jgi:hypothetical protein
MAYQLTRGHPENLALAKENLRKFDLVGVAEEFDKSLKLFSQALGWPKVEYKMENVTPKRIQVSDLTAEELHTLVTKNKNDIELYELARELFEERCRWFKV